MASHAEIEILKVLLKNLGGDATVQELGKRYSSETNSIIDVKRYGVKTFVQYLKLHQQDFTVYRDPSKTIDFIRVRLVIIKKSSKNAACPSHGKKDFNAWHMPPPLHPPKKPLQLPPLLVPPTKTVQRSAPKQRLELPEGFIRQQERMMQSSPSIQSVASTDFLEGHFVSSTPLPTEELNLAHNESAISELHFSCTESTRSRTRRQIKSWTPQELAKLKVQEQKAGESEVAEQLTENDFSDDDTLSLPELVSVRSIGSIDDISILSLADATRADRSATIYEPDDELYSSDDEHYENNVYEMMKSISCLTLNITRCTEESVDGTENVDFSYQRLDNSNENSQVQVIDQLNCAVASSCQAEIPSLSNRTVESLKTELEMDTIEFAPETLPDPEATILDPIQFIASLRMDDDLFLAKFPEVIQDPSLQLEWEETPKREEFDVYISEVYSPQNFWFQLSHDVEQLMDELDKDYSVLRGRQLMISDEKLVPGLLVACYIPDFERWHRAKVIRSPNSSDEARLLLLDYGTVGNIKKHHIRFLFRKYLRYPRYSHRGRFKNLKPPGGENSWNEQLVNRFLVKVSDQKLGAKILSFNEDDHVFELDLTLDKKSSNPINLRKWLISSWLCEPFELQPGNTYPMCYYFPSFEMLEQNHPAFHEKSVWLTQNVDYDLLVDTNYFESVSEETLLQNPKLLAMLGNERYRDAKKYYFTS